MEVVFCCDAGNWLASEQVQEENGHFACYAFDNRMINILHHRCAAELLVYCCNMRLTIVFVWYWRINNRKLRDIDRQSGTLLSNLEAIGDDLEPSDDRLTKPRGGWMIEVMIMIVWNSAFSQRGFKIDFDHSKRQNFMKHGRNLIALPLLFKVPGNQFDISDTHFESKCFSSTRASQKLP
jgi:hypothetical protein